jgi:hypothetical protein
MIYIHESHLIFIILISFFFAYLVLSIFLSCDVNCNVNYYKIENKSINKNKENLNLEPINNIKDENIDSETYINNLLNLYN